MFQQKIFAFIKFFIGWPLSVLALIFIAKFVNVNLSETIAALKNANIFVLIISVFCFIVYFFIRCAVWQHILKAQGHSLDFKETAYSWGSSELKRYIPGNVWSFLGRTVLFEKKGIKKKTIITSLIIEGKLVIISCVFLSLPAIFFILHIFTKIQNQHEVFLLLIGLSASFLILMLFGKKIMSKLFLPFSWQQNLSLISLTVFSLLFFCLGTYFAISSIAYLNVYYLSTYLAYFAFALLVGYLSFITPMGLGVREGVITAGLLQAMLLSLAGIATIFARIVFMIGELSFLLLLLIWYRWKQKYVQKVEKFITTHRQETVLVILVFIYLLYFISATFLRYENYFTGRFDLGNMDQTVWNSLHGRFFQVTDPNGTDIISRLSFHADFILILLAPLYLLWSDPKMLLLLQTVILAFGGIFLYVLSKNVLKSKNFGLLITLLFFLNPAVTYTNLYDFHPITLATTFLIATFYFLQKRKYFLMILFLFLASITKEEVWVIAGLFGIFLAIKEKKRLLGITLSIISFTIFYALLFIIIPHVRGSQHFALAYYSDFGATPGSIIKNIIFSPLKTFGTILQKYQLSYLLELFLPFGFIAFFAPVYLLFALPDIVINVLSSNPQLHEIYYQYSATITPFLFIATIYGIKNILQKKLLAPKVLALILLSATCMTAYAYGPLPLSKSPNVSMFNEQMPNSTTVDNFLSVIPARYSIAATNNIGSHLSHRQRIYTIPVGIDKADIVVFLLNDPFAQPSLKIQKQMANDMKNDKNYTKLFEKNEFIVFAKSTIFVQLRRRKMTNFLQILFGS